MSTAPVITAQECFEHFRGFIGRGKLGLRSFYDDQALFVQAALGAAMVTELVEQGCGKDVAKDLALLTLYDLVLLLDDSSSMETEENGARIETLKSVLAEITGIYNLANPQGILSARFLNAKTGRRNVKNETVKRLLDGRAFYGVTRIGTEFDRKIVKRFLLTNELKRPVLVITIVDGAIEGERSGHLEDVILNCVKNLKNPESIALQFSRVGNDKGAQAFLEYLANDSAVRDYVDCLPAKLPLERISDPDYRWAVLPHLLVGAIVDNRDRLDYDVSYEEERAIPGGSSRNVSCVIKTSNSILNRYRLDTKFYDDGELVIHTMFKINSQGREVRVKESWKEKETLGEGGYGIVTLQEDEGGHFRAVKQLNHRMAANKCMELEALAAVSDRKDLFVEFLGWYENRRFLFIAMEYIEHGDLSQYIKSEEIRLDAQEITRQVLEGLVVLHNRNICHRDLKPQNILIASRDPIHVKIADFGASKALEGTSARTQIGTVGYLAPEVRGLIPLAPGTTSYTNAVDLWSLGCIVYEMLALQPPFSITASQSYYTGTDSEIGMGCPEQDIGMIYQFCNGLIPLPVEGLHSGGASDKAIELVTSLLRAKPLSRPTAVAALESPWIRKPVDILTDHQDCVLSDDEE